MIAQIAAVAAVSAAALPLMGMRWRPRALPRPSIFNMGAEELRGAREAASAACVFAACAACGLSLASAGAGPLRTLLTVASVGAFGCAAAIDAAYRLVPRTLVLAGVALSVACGCARGPGSIVAALLSGATVWGGALAFEALRGAEAAGAGDVVLALHVGATFGLDMTSWGAFLAAAVSASVAALLYMRWKDNDDMVPLYALMLLPYLTGVIAGA